MSQSLPPLPPIGTDGKLKDEHLELVVGGLGPIQGPGAPCPAPFESLDHYFGAILQRHVGG